jgi:DNA-binding NarL/FixJ family response regulator
MASMNITLIEDDSRTRQRIALLLARCLPYANLTTFDNLASSLAFAKYHQQDYWLIDLGLPDGSGIDLIRAVRAQSAQAHILVISVFGDVDSVLTSIQAGANGYLLKDVIDKDLVDALAAIEQGGTPLSPMIASRLLEGMHVVAPKRATLTSNLSLTEKQIELLNLLSRGYMYAEAARLMGVSISTVQTHVRRIYERLAVGSRAEAVFEAKAMGLLA